MTTKHDSNIIQRNLHHTASCCRIKQAEFLMQLSNSHVLTNADLNHTNITNVIALCH